MTRPAMPVIGMTAAALVLLTACGGGGGDRGADKIRATGTGSPSASASASATATSTVQRPVITFPADAKTVYEDQHTGDPKKDAVLADESYANDATYAAITEGKNRTPAMEFSHGGVALGGAADFVQGWLNKDNTWVGTIRYFNRKATLRPDGSAVVIYCSDESQASIKSRKTGMVDNSPATATSYVLYNERLQKNPQGVWILVSILSNRGAKECQP